MSAKRRSGGNARVITRAPLVKAGASRELTDDQFVTSSGQTRPKFVEATLRANPKISAKSVLEIPTAALVYTFGSITGPRQ